MDDDEDLGRNVVRALRTYPGNNFGSEVQIQETMYVFNPFRYATRGDNDDNALGEQVRWIERVVCVVHVRVHSYEGRN